MSRVYAAVAVAGGIFVAVGAWMMLPAAGVVSLGVLMLAAGVQALRDGDR